MDFDQPFPGIRREGPELGAFLGDILGSDPTALFVSGGAKAVGKRRFEIPEYFNPS